MDSEGWRPVEGRVGDAAPTKRSGAAAGGAKIGKIGVGVGANAWGMG